jgi:pyridoxine 4-dehydrogenase
VPALRPAELRTGVEEDLRSLRLEQLPVVHLRWIPQAEVAFTEALDALIAIQREGLIRHLALSNVTVAQLETALARTPIVCVQNLYNLAGPAAPVPGIASGEPADAMLAACEARGLAFLPFFPLAIGNLAATSGSLAAAAQRHGCTPAQLALAWLLARSPAMLPIPGTSQVMHLEENVGAVHVALDAGALAALAPNA